MDLITVFRAVNSLWQNPSATELSEEAFIEVANRCISQRFLDLDLTPDACFSTAVSPSFTFSGSTSRTRELSGVCDDISRVIRVESRGTGSTNEDDWLEEKLASFENWQETLDRGDFNFVSLYRNGDGTFLVIGRDPSSMEFRIVYRQLRDKIEGVGELIDLPVVFEPLLTYDIALELSEVIDNDSPAFQAKKRDKMPFLIGRQQDALKRIERWERAQRGVGVTRRRPFNDRTPTFGQSGVRRFSVRW